MNMVGEVVNEKYYGITHTEKVDLVDLSLCNRFCLLFFCWSLFLLEPSEVSIY